MSKLRYLATYSGPSFGAGYPFEKMEGFNSLYEVTCEMHRRQTMGYGYTTTYAENADGLYVEWEPEKRYNFPGTTTEDIMELYGVTDKGDGTYFRHDEPSFRLSVGPRGGIAREAC
jgi:hypothetical protein